MRLRLHVVPNAQQQIEEAAEWWRLNRRSAPELFAEQIEYGFDLATTQPNAAVRARDAQLEGVRRLLLSRIHYYLYYVVQGDTVEILALWHASRGTRPPL